MKKLTWNNLILIAVIIFVLTITLLIFAGVVGIVEARSDLPGKVNPVQPDVSQPAPKAKQVEASQDEDLPGYDIGDCDLPPEICLCQLYPETCPEKPTEAKPPGWDYVLPTSTPWPEIPNCPRDGELPPEVCDCQVNGNCPDTPTPNYPPGYTPEP